jgi:general secretion pathway protein G
LIKGRQNAAKAEIATIEQALNTFYTEYGRYPSNEEGLDILTKKTDKFPEPLLTRQPVDPWSPPYQYLCPGRGGQAYEVICFGADGREGGEGGDADICLTPQQTNSRNAVGP